MTRIPLRSRPMRTIPAGGAIALALLLPLALSGCRAGARAVTATAALPAAAAAASAPQAPATAPRAEVMVLGTFHFDDQGLDDHKPTSRPDMLSPARQREVQGLVAALERFRPTVIAVEWPATRQRALDSAYAAYRAGGAAPAANEIHQLGFRLAARLPGARLLAVDAPARAYEAQPTTEALIGRAESRGQQELIARATRWLEAHARYQAGVDSLVGRSTLAEALRYLNSPTYLRQSHAQYLVGHLEVGGDGDYAGADMRTAWYNRNIRIFSNLQRGVRGSGERVLLIVGVGHASILRHLIGGTPELVLVDPTSAIPPA